MSVDNNVGHGTRSQDQPTQRKSRMRNVSIAAIVLLLAAGGVSWFWFNERLSGPTAAMAQAVLPPQVAVAKPVVKNIIEWDDFTGAEMRVALGTAVFSGMLGVTFFGLFLTPVFYVTVRSLVGRGRKHALVA
jgi:AcrB/AcrD/AcrF family